MAKKPANKKSVLKLAEQKVEAPKPVAPELLAKLETMRILSIIHDLLHKGQFTIHFGPAIAQSISFIKAMHSQTTEGALVHPDAHLVAELEQLRPKKDA